jgi:hypothetical protein
MKRKFLVTLVVVTLILLVAAGVGTAGDKTSWSFKAQYIESCSCDLFCPCFFNTSPEYDFCKFNNALKIMSGHYGKVKLDGMKIWMSGDLGADFSKGETKQLILTFEPSATQEQVDAAMAVLGQIYPVKWKEGVKVYRAPIVWQRGMDKAYAKLGNGEGEVELTLFKGSDGKSPVVIKNLKYFNAQKNSGFTLYKAKHHYKGPDAEYAFENVNGFTIDLEASGK